MALEVGTKLGTYVIQAAIGTGGMGEVYRAKDTKLGREVAIKVLHEALRQDEERLARFEREARVLASLNHPGIATLHGLETEGSITYLVMELVHGETLQERLGRGPLTFEEAANIFEQIAEALEAAHAAGVVHRDLKPANIKITPEGRVKILDFGLAKAFALEEPVSDLSSSPTLTRGATAVGVIMGTASYMSPERARGKKADKRADIWAFGCVLFEAVSGKKAFDGESVTDILANVIHKNVPWEILPVETPWRVRGVLHRCLAKGPGQRFHDMADARIRGSRASMRARRTILELWSLRSCSFSHHAARNSDAASLSQDKRRPSTSDWLRGNSEPTASIEAALRRTSSARSMSGWLGAAFTSP